MSELKQKIMEAVNTYLESRLKGESIPISLYHGLKVMYQYLTKPKVSKDT